MHANILENICIYLKSDVCYRTGIINIVQMTERYPVLGCKAQGPQHYSIVSCKVMACHT